VRDIKIPLIGFAAYSGTGKTTLLVSLIRIFKERSLRVGMIKHAHHNFEIDYPGKDSFELRKAGATQVYVCSGTRWALMVEREPGPADTLQDHIDRLDAKNLDLILVEGFKPAIIPKIELHRPILGKPLLFPQDSSIIAIATDKPELMTTALPVLDLNDPEAIAAFISEHILHQHAANAVEI
jgi:molybdopterin-guanine dinucleotide biosynthesis protein B